VEVNGGSRDWRIWKSPAACMSCTKLALSGSSFALSLYGVHW
jgi:hypothetical protein